MPSPTRSARLPVPIIWGQTQRSWPRYTDPKRVRYAPMALALTERYAYDAHTAAYSTPTWPYRLSSGALLPDSKPRLPDGVAMVLAAFDIDCPISHRASGGSGDLVAADEWWQTELRKVQELAQYHPDPFAFRTRGGYRVLYLQPEPHILCDPTDREVWSTSYLAWCAYLTRAFDIAADPSCKDWTRLYRLPHATREEAGHPEEWETWGDPRHIGVWHCEPTTEDVALAQTLSRRKAAVDASPRRVTRWIGANQMSGYGVLYHAFHARGWLGQEIEAGSKFAVACPWEHVHTKGERFDTSTILFVPGPGDALGWWYCSHAHCIGRDLRDVLALFSPAELDRAREQAGLPPQRGRLRATGTTGGLRTVQAARVPLGRTIPASEVKSWR